jgi:hypothetical protein
MANALDCRVRALRYSVAARRTSEPPVRHLLADMAALWIKLASELERTHTTVDDNVLGYQSNSKQPNDGFGSLADIAATFPIARFTPESGHGQMSAKCQSATLPLSRSQERH